MQLHLKLRYKNVYGENGKKYEAVLQLVFNSYKREKNIDVEFALVSF